MKEQPRILSILSFVQMCKLFSHYGVRTILVLYMISTLNFSEKYSFGVSAYFCGFFELMCLFGGAFADRYLGLSPALFCGSGMLCIGYIALLFERAFFPALGLIVVGNSLFSPAISALVGGAYEGKDPRRKKGFTIFYMMQNAGACLSTVVCGFVAQWYGYSAAFAMASCGMIVGIIILALHRRHIVETQEKSHSLAERFPRKLIYLIGINLGALILFYAASEQICSSLIVFAEKATEKVMFGVAVPSSFIMTTNPVVIVLCGAIVARYRFGLMIPLLLVACSFAGLSFLSQVSGQVSITTVVGVIALISLAELMIGPTVTSFISEVSATRNPAAAMGLLSASIAVSSFLAGGLGMLVACDGTESSSAVYQDGFLKIALICLAGGIAAKILISIVSPEKEETESLA
jgi:POT family proton-dependent oligopeptide transporter